MMRWSWNEDEILAAMRVMALEAHLLVEPAGAAALAAAARLTHASPGTVVLIATGANVTDEVLRRAFS
jgi:threonine dehydratase